MNLKQFARRIKKVAFLPVLTPLMEFPLSMYYLQEIPLVNMQKGNKEKRHLYTGRYNQLWHLSMTKYVINNKLPS